MPTVMTNNYSSSSSCSTISIIANAQQVVEPPPGPPPVLEQGQGQEMVQGQELVQEQAQEQQEELQPPDSELEPFVPLPKKGKKGDKCPILAPKAMSMNPTMIASYPGSGAKLTWKLIRAVSGYMTSDDAIDLNNLSKTKQVIAIKTHYPARGSTPALFAPYNDVPRSVLLIRNPFNAIPSFHSFIYEQSLQLTGHSQRAPVNRWITWRDKHFEMELDLWVTHTRFWMTHHPSEDRLIVPYEYLIKRGSGPTELRKLRTFLEAFVFGDSGGNSNLKGMPHREKGKGSVTIMRTSKEQTGCIWDHIVMKRDDQGTNKGSMREGGPTVWPYTKEQAHLMIQELERLKLDYPGQLGTLMEMYIYQITDQMKQNNQSELE
jgi:hypothetical protein